MSVTLVVVVVSPVLLSLNPVHVPAFFIGQHEPPPPRQHAGLLPESLIWAYIVQLSSALRTVHTAGLACRVMDPSKILITGKTRYKHGHAQTCKLTWAKAMHRFAVSVPCLHS